jgi:hypothetical protein
MFEYNGAMQLGDPSAAEHTDRFPIDAALNRLNDDISELLKAVEAGDLDQLDAAQKLAVWQRFETFRNKLPLVDHSLIANAQASDLARE